MKNTLNSVSIVFGLLFTGPMLANSTLHDASDLRLLQAACPMNWSSIDSAIPSESDQPIAPTSVTWQDAADKEDFMLFQRNFILDTYGSNKSLEGVAADPLLVASECLKRHNLVLNAHFDRDIGIEPILNESLPAHLMIIINHSLLGGSH